MAEKNKTVLGLILVLCSLECLYSFSSRTQVRNSQLVESVEFGEINWTAGVLTVEARENLPPVIKDRESPAYRENPEHSARDLAEARSMARSLALKKAGQHLFNAVLHVRIKNDFYIKDHISGATNDFPFTLQSFLDRNRKPEHIYNKDGSVSLRMSIRLYGKNGLITLFTEKDLELLFGTAGSSVAGTVREQFQKNQEEVKQKFSSLVVDAESIKEIQPALFPLLYDENGTVLYSPFICPDEIKKSGFVSYLPSVTLISNVSYIDDACCIVKAVSAYDRTDLILPREKMNRFFSDPETLPVLRQCRVVVIIHP